LSERVRVRRHYGPLCSTRVAAKSLFTLYGVLSSQVRARHFRLFKYGWVVFSVVLCGDALVVSFVVLFMLCVCARDLRLAVRGVPKGALRTQSAYQAPLWGG